MLDPTAPVKNGGGPAIHLRRRIVEAVFHVDRTACVWRTMMFDFPPRDTVYRYFQRWAADRTTDRIPDALRAAVRDAAGRGPRAAAEMVGSRSLKGANTVGPVSCCYDAGNKANGRSRHLVVDTRGLFVVVLISVQDHDGARLVPDKASM